MHVFLFYETPTLLQMKSYVIPWPFTMLLSVSVMVDLNSCLCQLEISFGFSRLPCSVFIHISFPNGYCLGLPHFRICQIGYGEDQLWVKNLLKVTTQGLPRTRLKLVLSTSHVGHTNQSTTVSHCIIVTVTCTNMRDFNTSLHSGSVHFIVRTRC